MLKTIRLALTTVKIQSFTMYSVVSKRAKGILDQKNLSIGKFIKDSYNAISKTGTIFISIDYRQIDVEIVSVYSITEVIELGLNICVMAPFNIKKIRYPETSKKILLAIAIWYRKDNDFIVVIIIH